MGIFFRLTLLRISLLIINITLQNSSFLSIAINQLNNFIYLQRLRDMIVQSYSGECSFSKGSNCFFTENKRADIYEQKYNTNKEINTENKNEIKKYNDKTIIDINKEWMDFYIKSRNVGLISSFTELNEYLTQYQEYILSKSDTSQIPLPLTLRLSLTFESYDDMTIKEDIYAYPSKPVQFLTETIYIEFIGKLKLRYGEDLKLRDQMKYPSKTFGIIESSNLFIKLGGKQFVCESFFIRIREAKIRKLNINGYLGNIKAFSMSRDINFMTDKDWLKIDLPSTKVDRIELPGGIDIDNFRFTIETIQQYDISVHFHNKYVRSIEELIHDNDI